MIQPENEVGEYPVGNIHQFGKLLNTAEEGQHYASKYRAFSRKYKVNNIMQWGNKNTLTITN